MAIAPVYLSTVDTVFFDMDGTLFMSERVGPVAARLSVAKVYAEEGIDEPLPPLEHFLDQVGKAHMDYFRGILPERHQHLAERVRDLVIENELKLIEEIGGTAFPGACETLAELKRRGYRLAMASNCGTRYFNAVSAACGFDEHLDLRLCIGDRGFCPKAELIQEMMTVLEARGSILVGDRIHDLQAARTCRIPFVGVDWGYGSDGELDEADAQIDTFEQLLDLLPGPVASGQST